MEKNLKQNDGESATADSPVLNDETTKRLWSMFNSRDVADHVMAREILNKIDVQKSIYWIWLLANEHAPRMVYLRTKASREFRDKCDLFTIAYADATEFGVWLNQKGWLTPELFSKLKGNMIREARDSTDNFFYNFQVQIKNKFINLDPLSPITKLTHD